MKFFGPLFSKIFVTFSNRTNSLSAFLQVQLSNIFSYLLSVNDRKKKYLF